LKKIILSLLLVCTMPFTLLANNSTTYKHAKQSELTKSLIRKISNDKNKHFKNKKYVKSTKNYSNSKKHKVMHVTATAYTSSKRETQGDPTIAAWGTKLKPGMKVIAVSRDLLKKGMRNGTRVKIDGLSGTYIVRDKMAARWRNKIDIYMGNSRSKAMQWGRRKVVIRWA